MLAQTIQFKRRFTAIAGCLVLLMPVPRGYADPSPEQLEKLKELREQITELKKTLDQDHNARDELTAQLQNIDKQIAASTLKIRELNQTLQRNQQQLSELETKQNQLSKQLFAQQRQLSDHIRAAYQIGQQEYLKLLLNQQDPAATARTLVYYRYFNEARLNGINAIKTNLQEIDSLKKTAQEEVQRLEATRLEQQKEKSIYEDTQLNRNQMVATLTEQIRAKGTQLQLLQENEANLKGLLDAIQDHYSAPPPQDESPQLEAKTFAQLKGQLIWPTRGKIVAHYGGKRNIGNMRWNGVLIANDRGGAVYAVAPGTVVFADWLRGFGLLMIIDHGLGYMTLYGHNESLGKQMGDTVTRNELIAQVGNSGGQKSAGLYFEIRYNGKPVNPSQWCSKLPELAILSNNTPTP